MLSVIIPVFNEADQIANTMAAINTAAKKVTVEIIVVDGGSTDDTFSIAQQQGARVFLSEKKGRAAQMNFGAKQARFSILYFLHADSAPPQNFDRQITTAVQNGFFCGCFRLRFDFDHWFLNANAWFTRFNLNAFRFGDQSLFVTKEVFRQSGGFREDFFIMEDQEIIHRLKRVAKFIILQDFVITSARKYHTNGIYRMQMIFFGIWLSYYLGYSQQQLAGLYKSWIKN